MESGQEAEFGRLLCDLAEFLRVGLALLDALADALASLLELAHKLYQS